MSGNDSNSDESQNNHQEDLVFDSSKLKDKPQTEYFVRVEGAEKRKRELIQHLAKQKKELEQEQKAKQKAEQAEAKLAQAKRQKQQKIAHQAEQTKKRAQRKAVCRSRWQNFFAKCRKYFKPTAISVAILASIALLVFCGIKLSNYYQDNRLRLTGAQSEEDVTATRERMLEIYGDDHSTYDEYSGEQVFQGGTEAQYQETLKYLNDVISKTSDQNNQFSLKSLKIDYLLANNRPEEVLETLNSIDFDSLNFDQKILILTQKSRYYETTDQVDLRIEIDNQIRELYKEEKGEINENL